MKRFLVVLLTLVLTAALYPQQRLGKHTVVEWRHIIDTTWGPGESTSEKLRIFDLFWNAVDQRYAGFRGIVDRWQEMKAYRDTVALGVSRGRFAGIIDRMMLSLQDIHVWMLDNGIAPTPLNPGIPLLYSLGVELPSFNWGASSHFGAALTPLPDSSLLVYAAAPNHPLGLARGDVVLGYDRKPWRTLYRQLFEVEFPVPMGGVSYTSERASAHQWLGAAGMNWHLFDTIDIAKYGTTDTLHLPTYLLASPMPSVTASEQMPIDGVPFPDVAGNHLVSWGCIKGTKIGYIYACAWASSAEVEFLAAVNALMPESSSDGIILDLRLNVGGTSAYMTGFRRLFNEDVHPMRILVRESPYDHLAMTDAGPYFLEGSDKEVYDRPIAVLCGPSTISAADKSVQFLRWHPMVRTFGLPTNGAFGSYSTDLGIPAGWTTAVCDVVDYTPPNTNDVLNHTSVPVDEEVWLTRDDVAKGEDTVVKRALAWMTTLAYAHRAAPATPYARPGVDSVTATAVLTNPLGQSVSLLLSIANSGGAVVDSVVMVNDGLHGDGLPGDSIWGARFRAPSGEDFYPINLCTRNHTLGTSRTLRRATFFTTVGPVVCVGDTSDKVPAWGLTVRFKFKLQNLATVYEARNLAVRIRPLDTSAVCANAVLQYPTIAPGQSSYGSSIQTIGFSKWCSGTRDIPLELRVSSGGMEFWRDTLLVRVTDSPSGIQQQRELPVSFALAQNYPNPFNPSTTITYKLPRAEQVTLRVYDVLGRELVTLVNDGVDAGYHEVTFNASQHSSGVYLYQLRAGDYVSVKKMLLVR